MATTIQTPGVYISENNAFPNSVVPVATAVPAFIGYTPQASYDGKSYLNVPVKITSFAEFVSFFCYPDPAPPASPAKQYSPQYYLQHSAAKPASGNAIQLSNGNWYVILPDPQTIYYLYNSIQLFYQNGGGEAYIVSVGGYGTPSNKPLQPGEPLINPNVQLDDLLNGLATLQNESEPTLYICPEATLLSVADNSTLMQAMLQQSNNMGTSVSLFDIIGGHASDPDLMMNDIDTFRNSTGINALSYGAAYYPFVGTTIMQAADVEYTNLFAGDVAKLAAIINPPGSENPAVTQILADMTNPASHLTIAQHQNALLIASPDYKLITDAVLKQANVLPATGAIAGVITTVDNNNGCWQAPANVSINSAVWLPINLNDNQQSQLNVDAVTGKSINVIRSFRGQGILVWGARTLDGNSNDWRYISVRRTITFIEQSCKQALEQYLFEPNDANTWVRVKTMIESFLNTLWLQGAMLGAKPADAYTVECGLGTTMDQQDILNGKMRITMMVAIIRPAEFIVITLEQQLAQQP